MTDEGKELEIKELKEKIEMLDFFYEGNGFKNRGLNNSIQIAEYIDKLEKENAELEQQIEKMKCWCNCKNYLSCLEECCRKNTSFEKGICYNCKKWEIKEK